MLLSLLPLLGLATASPLRRDLNPTVKTATLYGPIAEFEPQYLDRDSCGTSAALFGDRVLFVCRDTEIYIDRQNTSEGVGAFYSSSASWINKNPDGSLPFVPFNSSDYGYQPGYDHLLPAYGLNNNKSFYPLQPDENPDTEGVDQSANGGNGTRWVIWPDTPPLVTKIENGCYTAYTWIKQAKITLQLGVAILYPATSLYKVEYSPDKEGTGDTLPSVSIVDEQFFKQGEWNYGTYGSVAKDGWSYLYGQPLNSVNVSLAKVQSGSEEDLSQYQYYVGGEWTSTMPGINDTASWLPCTAGSQGTFYYSEPWQSYVWIGQASGLAAGIFQLWITTAPAPEGPWTTPKQFYENDDNQRGFRYTVQAHPAFLTSPQENAVWVSYTEAINGYGYDTVLYKFDWE